MKKNNLLKLLCASSLIFIFYSCKKDKLEDKITLTVTPAETFISVVPGQIKNFTITGASPVKLQRLKITFKTAGGLLSTLLDSLLEVKNITLQYPFKVPNYGTQNVSISMYFELIDTDGNSINVSKGIDVAYGDRALTSIVGNELNSRNSGLPSAYNLRSSSSLVYTTPYTEDMNITDTLQADSLSKAWISPAGGFFVKDNSFFYDFATLSYLKNAYEGAAKTNKISGLKIGDVILYKQTYGIEAFYAAMKITDIQNNPGASNDKYIIDIKK